MALGFSRPHSRHAEAAVRTPRSPNRAIFRRFSDLRAGRGANLRRAEYHARYRYSTGEDLMAFVTSAKTVTRILLVTVLLLTFAGILAKGLRWMFGNEGLMSFLGLFYLGEEA